MRVSKFSKRNLVGRDSLSFVLHTPALRAKQTMSTEEHRQKSAEELDQERRDEEFARQLSQEGSPQAPLPPPPTTTTSSTVGHAPPSAGSAATPQMPCATCDTINNIHPTKLALRHLCGGCQRLLPPFDPNAMPQYLAFRQAQAAKIRRQQGLLMPGAGRPQVPPPVHTVLPNTTESVPCPTCGATNLLPTGNAGAFLCGSCHGALPSPRLIATGPQPPVHIVQQMPTQPPQGGAQPPVPQGMPIQAAVMQSQTAAITRQFRCGQCPQVNAVVVDVGVPEVTFRCTACHAVNKARIA